MIRYRSGLDVITTCSPANFDLVKSLGASAAFDYQAPDCGEAINAYTKGKLHHALDCISEEASAAICSKALSKDTSSQAAKYCSTLPVQFPREDVVSTFILGYTVVGEAFHKIVDFPAKPEDYEFATKFYRIAEQLLNEQKLLPHPIEVREGGLEGVPGGLEDLKAGRVRARKLVYPIA
jgi:NADPH:quinone reductase-like Zn-dependent oxidoreductase